MSYIILTTVTSNVIRYEGCYMLVTHVTIIVTILYDT